MNTRDKIFNSFKIGAKRNRRIRRNNGLTRTDLVKYWDSFNGDLVDRVGQIKANK